MLYISTLALFVVVVKCAHTAEMFRVPAVAYKPCVDKIYSDTVKKHSIRVEFCSVVLAETGKSFFFTVSAEHLSC